MNKQQLVNEIAKKSKLSKSQSLQILNTTFDAIRASLRKQQRVQLIGFGTFLVRQRTGAREQVSDARGAFPDA